MFPDSIEQEYIEFNSKNKNGKELEVLLREFFFSNITFKEA